MNIAVKQLSGNMRERSGLLRDYWYAACLSQSVTQKKPHSVVIMETRIVIWRNPQGKPVALRDRCLHRNTLLSEGTVKQGCIACPYHGWQFNEQGECVNVPSEGEDGKAYPQRRVETFHCQEKYGLIWVWMGVGTAPDKDPFPMPHWDARDQGWECYYMQTDFDNNVTNLAENFMDVPHTVFVHQGWFRSRSKKHVRATVERTDSSVLVTYHQEKDQIGVYDRILNPKRLSLVHTDNFYMPNNTRVDYIWGNQERGFVITSTCTPISDYKTRVFTLISYKLGLLNKGAKAWLPWYTRQVIQQDVDIMANQGKALQEAPAEFKHTPADTLHIFIESLRHYAESGGTLRKPEPKLREIEFWI
jgi:phenylpropionate dioxygenase-like ring-hydroxylating dioxygenase large terminal subunit